MNKGIKEYRLLFKGKRDGFGSKDFHSKCDNKSYTVSFVKSKEGRRWIYLCLNGIKVVIKKDQWFYFFIG